MILVFGVFLILFGVVWYWYVKSGMVATLILWMDHALYTSAPVCTSPEPRQLALRATLKRAPRACNSWPIPAHPYPRRTLGVPWMAWARTGRPVVAGGSVTLSPG